jgi:site-specific recombinase XerD
MRELADIEPVHVSVYIETLQKRLAPPSVKQHLAAIRMLFDWLAVGRVIAVNPIFRQEGQARPFCRLLRLVLCSTR